MCWQFPHPLKSHSICLGVNISNLGLAATSETQWRSLKIRRGAFIRILPFCNRLPCFSIKETQNSLRLALQQIPHWHQLVLHRVGPWRHLPWYQWPDMQRADPWQLMFYLNASKGNRLFCFSISTPNTLPSCQRQGLGLAFQVSRSGPCSRRRFAARTALRTATHGSCRHHLELGRRGHVLNSDDFKQKGIGFGRERSMAPTLDLERPCPSTSHFPASCVAALAPLFHTPIGAAAVCHT